MTTAFITFIAVVSRYVFEALPADYYNEFDRSSHGPHQKAIKMAAPAARMGCRYDAKFMGMKSKMLERSANI